MISVAHLSLAISARQLVPETGNWFLYTADKHGFYPKYTPKIEKSIPAKANHCDQHRIYLLDPVAQNCFLLN